MSDRAAICLINQSACGRVAGNPVCPKCGMDERVVYPGQADREAAQAAAMALYMTAQEAVNPLVPTEPQSRSIQQPDPLPPAIPYADKKGGFNRLGATVLVFAVLGGAWWWRHQDAPLRQIEGMALNPGSNSGQSHAASGAVGKRPDPGFVPLKEPARVVVEAGMVTFYFAAGKSDLPEGSLDALQNAVAAANSGRKLVISGVHDGRGDPALNAELAKSRALAVTIHRT